MKGGTYTEHLEPHDRKWKHPTHADIQTVSVVQIIPCNIIGSWDLTKHDMTFILENWHMIDILLLNELLPQMWSMQFEHCNI